VCPKAFYDRIIITIAFSAHTDLDLILQPEYHGSGDLHIAHLDLNDAAILFLAGH